MRELEAELERAAEARSAAVKKAVDPLRAMVAHLELSLSDLRAKSREEPRRLVAPAAQHQSPVVRRGDRSHRPSPAAHVNALPSKPAVALGLSGSIAKRPQKRKFSPSPSDLGQGDMSLGPRTPAQPAAAAAAGSAPVSARLTPPTAQVPPGARHSGQRQALHHARPPVAAVAAAAAPVPPHALPNRRRRRQEAAVPTGARYTAVSARAAHTWAPKSNPTRSKPSPEDMLFGTKNIDPYAFIEGSTSPV